MHPATNIAAASIVPTNIRGDLFIAFLLATGIDGHSGPLV
jgi:hypothetical protein